jgi:hypothetical protein
LKWRIVWIISIILCKYCKQLTVTPCYSEQFTL